MKSTVTLLILFAMVPVGRARANDLGTPPPAPVVTDATPAFGQPRPGEGEVDYIPWPPPTDHIPCRVGRTCVFVVPPAPTNGVSAAAAKKIAAAVRAALAGAVTSGVVVGPPVRAPCDRTCVGAAAQAAEYPYAARMEIEVDGRSATLAVYVGTADGGDEFDVQVKTDRRGAAGLAAAFDAHAGARLARGAGLPLTTNAARLLTAGPDALAGLEAEVRTAGSRASRCAAGEGTACFELGQACAEGVERPREPERAVKLLELACRHGSAEGCAAAAAAWVWSEGVVPRSIAVAAPLFERGCVLGDRPSCVAAALVFAAGSGVTRDMPRAERLRRRACHDFVFVPENEKGFCDAPSPPPPASRP